MDACTADGGAAWRACTLTAQAIDLAHEGASSADGDKQKVADAIAQTLDLDMTRHWSPSIEFWLRLSKDMLIEELKSALEIAGLTPSQIAARLKDSRKLKKDALALCVHEAWQGRGYLPDLLVTPIAAGGLSVVAGDVAAA